MIRGYKNTFWCQVPAAFSVEPRLSATAEEEAYRHLQRALRLGRYKPGDRLIPEEIAAEIGMSRMPVREAFRRLASDGLVVLRPNRGCVVAGLTVDELYEIFEIRSVLEGLAVRLAMPRIDEEALEEFENLLDRMERAGQSGSSDWVIRHQEFHGRICALSRRPKLIHQVSALHVVIEPYMRIWFDDADKPLSAREEHAAVIAALRSGDARHAEEVMQDHILGTAPMLAEFVSASR
ncbi:GntR family transcriptional regulator [Mesorhizobium sp. B2-9-1]|uniref:GntR family transcriptional regulator n=1 Tax=Mesorhizobium sp. B2-9-1 TaxID=2589898 RepID=UPI001FEE84B0|nr:GntR family transcriptional regulator [Mesorhizobium sp. B2-9-1]